MLDFINNNEFSMTEKKEWTICGKIKISIKNRVYDLLTWSCVKYLIKNIFKDNFIILIL